jgi:signal transduction histidine kinase
MRFILRGLFGAVSKPARVPIGGHRMTNGCVASDFPAAAGSRPGTAVPPVMDRWADGVDDRRALAREVHDWIGTGLALALHQLDLFSLAAARGEPDASARVSQARRTLEDLQRATRRLVSDLQDRCWIGSLETEILEFVSQANLLGARTTVVVRGDQEALPPRTREEVFAVIREALRNAFTHACAEHVTVAVEIGADALRASVDDDGVGCDPATLTARRGGGLVVMQERAAALGGTLTITATRPRGTRVDLCIDLSRGDRGRGL